MNCQISEWAGYFFQKNIARILIAGCAFFRRKNISCVGGSRNFKKSKCPWTLILNDPVTTSVSSAVERSHRARTKAASELYDSSCRPHKPPPSRMVCRGILRTEVIHGGATTVTIHAYSIAVD